MICPKCKSENSDSAKFCKKCGNELVKKEATHKSLVNSINDEKKSDNTKIIIIALIIIAVVLAGAFIYLQGFGNGSHSNSADLSQSNASNSASPSNQESSSQSSESKAVKTQPSPMKIQGGSFSTGSELSDLTYANIFVGKEHAGESVILQIWYSRDGSTLNNGNMVPVTVHSDGYLEVQSADAYKYYPDHATINLYDSNSKLLDTKSVSLSPTSGTQTF